MKRLLLLIIGTILLFLCNSLQLISQTINVTVDAGASTGQLSQLWGDHYDLSITHADYLSDTAFLPMMQQLKPRYWRCSVGRWEIGFPSPVGGTSSDTTILKTVNREYYRGANNLTDANDASKYNFSYLDSQLIAISLTGAEPYLCFDYMPFTLSSEKNPNNPNNTSSNPIYTFFNGIRTAPPADSAVYASVVKNAIRHVRGQFAGTHDFGIHYIEIGNEPENLFWNGTQQQFFNMYKAIAGEVNSDTQITNLVKLGGGSFNDLDSVFMKNFLINIHQSATRLDFLSYHSYYNSEIIHYLKMAQVRQFVNTYAPSAEIVNGEWGRELVSPLPVFGTVEFGLFRARVMMLMEVFGIKISHESLFLLPGPNELGLLNRLPVHSKPVSDVYLGLNKMNDCLNALSVIAPNGEYAMAGKKTDNSKVCIVYIADSLTSSSSKTIQFQVNNLPWGNTNYYANRYEISDSTWTAGLGVYCASTQSGLSGAYNANVSYGPGPGKGKLMVLVLSTNPLTGINNIIDFSSEKIVVYPNPSKAKFSLVVPNGLKKAQLIITNTLGEIILKSEISNSKTEIDLSKKAKGIYFYKVISQSESATTIVGKGKLIVE
jgi:hypothetical protein